MLKDHTLPHSITGEKISLPTREIVIDNHVCERAADDLLRFDVGTRLALVADANTYAALGERLHSALEQKFNVEKFIFSDPPEPTPHAVSAVRKASTHADVLLAVGSGTINDICKQASFLEKKPYIVYATALSMNGYTSGNASILTNGYRQSMSAQPPLAVYADLGILAHSPIRLARAGFGDSLARVTAQIDWQLSHLLLDTPYDPLPFDLLRKCEEALFECCEGLPHGDRQALKLLAELLMLSGVGMWLVKGSYPASQGEHMIAHTMELKYPSLCSPLLHGEMIGVTTLTMAALQEKLLARSPILKMKPDEALRIQNYFEGKTGDGFEQKKKLLSNMESLNARIEESWPALRAFAEDVGLDRSRLEGLLKKTGAPYSSKMLGWPEEAYESTVRHAHFTRNRFTFLDILYYS